MWIWYVLRVFVRSSLYTLVFGETGNYSVRRFPSSIAFLAPTLFDIFIFLSPIAYQSFSFFLQSHCRLLFYCLRWTRYYPPSECGGFMPYRPPHDLIFLDCLSFWPALRYSRCSLFLDTRYWSFFVRWYPLGILFLSLGLLFEYHSEWNWFSILSAGFNEG